METFLQIPTVPSSEVDALPGTDCFNSPGPATPFAGRQKFACCDDVLLLREVNVLKPWETAHGKTMASSC